MGSDSGLSWCARWYRGIVGALVVSAFAPVASALTNGIVQFPNGDLATGVQDTVPDYWTCSTYDYDGQDGYYNDVAHGGPFLWVGGVGQQFWCYDEAYPGDFILNDGWRGGTYSVTAIMSQDNDEFHMGVQWYDIGGALLATHTGAQQGGYDASVTVTESVPLTADKARVYLYCDKINGSGCGARIISLNDMVISYTASSNSAPGEGQATDILYDPDIEDAIETATAVYDFVCGGGLEASAFSLIPDAWGGAGIGGQIAQVSNQLQMICLQTATADNAVAQTDAMTTPGSRPVVASPNSYTDLTDAPLSQQIDAYIAPQANQEDDLVTSTNRTNDLLVASIRYQNASMERAFGTNAARPAFQTESGPLMSQTDVDADPQIEFKEGDYGQTYGRLSTLVTDSGVSPDAAGAVPLEAPAAAIDPDGACLNPGMTRPSDDYSTVEEALAILRWNAAVTLSGTNMGEFLCSMADQPARTVTELCIGSEAPLTIMGTTLASAEPICIYGANAPSYMNVLIGFMPTISLLLAGVGILKMIF